jgi:outer membrane protein assembly factor BamB
LKIKIKSGIVIILIFLNILIVGWNLGFVAKNPENHSNCSWDVIKNPLSNEIFYCGIINCKNRNLGINQDDIMPKSIITRSLANSPWPMFRHDLNHTGLSPYNTSANAGKLVWNFTTNNYAIVSSSPAIDSDETIYIGSSDGNLYAIYPNGTKKWNFTTGASVMFSSPAISSDGTIYVGAYDGNLYAIYPNGTKKWNFPIGSFIQSSPAIGSNGTIYIGSHDANLYAIYPNGTEKWNFTTGNQIYSSPAIGSDGTIYIGSKDNNLYAIYPNGTKKWSYITGWSSSPAIGDDDMIYVGSTDNNLYAIYPNGSKKWNFLTKGAIWSSPAISSDGTIYIGSGDGNLYAIYPNSTKKWNFTTGAPVMFSSPAISSDGTIYVGSTDNNLYAIYLNGSKKWNFVTGGLIQSSPAIGSDGTIYVGSYDDRLYAIGITPLILSSGFVKPLLGFTNTFFNYSINYLHKFNKPPVCMNVSIDGINYTMNETDLNDINYSDGKDYFFNTTLNISTNHTFQFFAFADSLFTVSTPLIDAPDVINTPPFIYTYNNLTAIEDIYYEVNYEYNDIDRENVGQLGTWNFSTNASWLAFNSTTAVLNGTPLNEDVGQHWVNISVNDTMDMDFTNFTLTVLNINDNPIINTSNVGITYEDDLYEVDYDATDIDSLIENQIWSLGTNASSWLDIESSTGIISGIPTNEDVGSYWVNVSLNDSEGGSDFSNFTLIVLNVNDPPEIITEDITAAVVDEEYNVDYDAVDIDLGPQNFIWTLNTNATWLGINSGTGILSGTPVLDDLGWYNVNITVDDNYGGLDSHEFILTVIKENLPPLITTDDVLSATVDELYEVDYEATDVDTPLDKLRWSLNTNASWLIIDRITGVLSGTPALKDLGKYWVNVSVTDEVGAYDFHNFTLTVYLTPNLPPNILTEDIQNAVVGQEYSVDYEAEDDRTPVDKLRWFIKSNASWLSINENTGLLYGTPGPEHIGSYQINISVFDNEDGWDWHVFVLYVTQEPIDENNAPILSEPGITPFEGDTETEFIFTIHYYDADNDAPAYIRVVIDNSSYDMTLQTGEQANGTYVYKTKLSEGTHAYYFTASDGIDMVSTNDFTVEIEKLGKVSDDETSWWWLILLIIVVIIILLILFLIVRRKKKEEEKVEEVPQPPTALVEEPVQPSLSVEPTEKYPEEQISVSQQVNVVLPSQTSLIEDSNMEE